MCYDNHDQFVYRSAEQEGEQHCACARELVTSHRRCVDVTKEKRVHGLVPFAGEFIPRSRIPPNDQCLEEAKNLPELFLAEFTH
jgi:hypothetical protein